MEKGLVKCQSFFLVHSSFNISIFQSLHIFMLLGLMVMRCFL